MHGVDLSAILLEESDEVNKFVDGSVVRENIQFCFVLF